jgi:hypothetical protein
VSRPLCYVAHPLNAATREDIAANRLNGARWCAWLARHCGIAPAAPWIVLSSVWTEEEGRELGLEIDCDTIRRCDALILTGGRISSGMQVEIDFARSIGLPVCDLTGFNPVPPSYTYTPLAGEGYRRPIVEAVARTLAEAA